MAIDTQAKRASVLHIIQPDGTIAQTDRQTILWVYGGILSGELSFGDYVYVSLVISDWIAQSFTVGEWADMSHVIIERIAQSLEIE